MCSAPGVVLHLPVDSIDLILFRQTPIRSSFAMPVASHCHASRYHSLAVMKRIVILRIILSWCSKSLSLCAPIRAEIDGMHLLEKPLGTPSTRKWVHYALAGLPLKQSKHFPRCWGVPQCLLAATGSGSHYHPCTLSKRDNFIEFCKLFSEVSFKANFDWLF